MDKFTKLLDTLSAIGYEADNEDCVELEFNDGNGAVTFITKDLVQVRLPFTDWELDLNYVGHYLTFERKFRINSPAIGMGHLDICHTSQEFGVKLKLIVLPDQFIDRMKQASDCLAPITIEIMI
jgi:hypothetical protein